MHSLSIQHVINHGLQLHFVPVHHTNMWLSLCYKLSAWNWEHSPYGNGAGARQYFGVMFSGVLYPQMRPPTKQASRFRSTAKKNRPSLTNWDLVWPLVFKLLCHVSSNWYLMFSLPPLQPRKRLHSVFVPRSWLASSHCLCLRTWSKIWRLIYLVNEMFIYSAVLYVTPSFFGHLKQRTYSS